MKKFFLGVLIFFTVFFVGSCMMSIVGVMSFVSPSETKLSGDSILHLKLEGVIMDGEAFLKPLRKYAKKDHIKGVLIQVNSPGGVVGPSQEMYAELRRIRDELKKPVVVTVGAMAASGAYYAAAGADLIFVNPGSLMGSIGVIMEFANLEGLYDWAKVKRYNIKTGRYKDAGSDFREMSEDEKSLLQGLVDRVLDQFTQAIVEGRNLKAQLVDSYADGRIFTGAEAVELGFADEVGTFEDARRKVGELSELGDDPDLFSPRDPRQDFWEMFEEASSKTFLKSLISQKSKLLGQPLFLMPGVL